MFVKIYEDNASGKLSDDRFTMMRKTYEDEQNDLKEEDKSLQQEINRNDRQKI